jgi:SAM-dependent methyltransferase
MMHPQLTTAIPKPAASPPPDIDYGLYQDAYVRLGMVNINNVADLGCGEGHFAKVMVDRKQRPAVYWGVDLDLDIIQTARGRYPGWRFAYGDFFSDKIQMEFVKFDGFLVLNVLEYLEKDEELLRTIPSGRPVIFSVPAFEPEGALRWFKNDVEVRERYSSIVQIQHLGQYRSSDGEVYYMATCYRW